jgi:hypothetical protein
MASSRNDDCKILVSLYYVVCLLNYVAAYRATFRQKSTDIMIKFWISKPCRIVRLHRGFEKTYCFHHQGNEIKSISCRYGPTSAPSSFPVIVTRPTFHVIDIYNRPVSYPQWLQRLSDTFLFTQIPPKRPCLPAVPRGLSSDQDPPLRHTNP